jgi:hypothetical protein
MLGEDEADVVVGGFDLFGEGLPGGLGVVVEEDEFIGSLELWERVAGIFVSRVLISGFLSVLMRLMHKI